MMKAIGIDIGGTKIAAAAVDGAGHILARAVLPTEAPLGFERALRRIGTAVDELLDRAGWLRSDIEGIGIGCAGPVDAAGGLINNPHTLAGWDGCDIVSPLRERFGVPVRLENDADAAIVGECWTGAGRGLDPVVMLTFGTGVGGAAILDRRILRGAGGQHPEIGHICVTEAGPECYCGSRGCLESLASGPAIGASASPKFKGDPARVLEAAERGDAGAARVVDRAASASAAAAWTLFHALLPQRLILGGGLMDGYFDRFCRAIKERLAPATQFDQSKLSVTRAELGNNAGVIGAARLCHPSAPTSREKP